MAIERVNAIHLAERWGTLVGRGVAAVLFGILAFISPGMGLLTLVFLWGAFALIDGVLNLSFGFRRGRAGKPWGWLISEGAVAVAAAVAAFLWPGITALVLLAFVAARAIFAGVAQIATAIRIRREVTGEWMLVLTGALSTAFGVLLLLYPGPGLLTIVILIGSYSLLFGALLIGLGLRLRRWGRSTERPLPTGATPFRA
jgi:uncharacterized membrane protein HdeD (DUF308 family)